METVAMTAVGGLIFAIAALSALVLYVVRRVAAPKPKPQPRNGNGTSGNGAKP